MFNKKTLIGTISFLLMVFIGFIQINIVNTKALSPIGNGEDNYELVKEEFGEDFEEFIKDNAEVKIYSKDEEDNNTVVRIEDKEFKINTNNIVTQKIYALGSTIYNSLDGIKNLISEKIKKNDTEKNSSINQEKKENNTKIEENDEKLNKIIDDFLEKSN